MTAENESEYEKIKVKVAARPTPIEVEEYNTIEGEANVYFDTTTENTCNEINIGIKQLTNEFKQYILSYL